MKATGAEKLFTSTAMERAEAPSRDQDQHTSNRHTYPDFYPLVPVELFLQQVQARVQLAALLAAQAVYRRVEGRRGRQATAGNLLVLATAPTVPPETEDVRHA